MVPANGTLQVQLQSLLICSMSTSHWVNLLMGLQDATSVPPFLVLLDQTSSYFEATLNQVPPAADFRLPPQTALKGSVGMAARTANLFVIAQAVPEPGKANGLCFFRQTPASLFFRPGDFVTTIQATPPPAPPPP